LMRGEIPNYVIEKRYVTQSGQIVWAQVTASLVFDDQQRPAHRINVIEDVTDRRKRRLESARLAAIVQSAEQAVFSTDPDGTIAAWNPGAVKLFGLAKDEIQGQSLAMLLGPDEAITTENLLKSLASGQSLKVEARSHHKGRQLELLISAAPIMSGARVEGGSFIVEEIGDRKRWEAHIALLNRELAHRVKNSLAVVQSIANQTLRLSPDPVAFRQSFMGRLQSLAAATDLLMQSNWRGSELNSFIDKQLLPLLSEPQTQLKKSGPLTIIPASLTMPLGLALHELGANALKYGSLSAPDGRLELSWRQVDDQTEHWLELTWREIGGPQVEDPQRHGFGQKLIEEGVPNAKVERRFEPTGLVCQFKIDLQKAKGI
jgi:PAS domain S-box-containing protein